MTRGRWIVGVALGMGTLAGVSQTIVAQQPAPRAGREQLTQPVYRVAQQPAGQQSAAPQQQLAPQQPAAPQQQPAIVANNAALPGKGDVITPDGVSPAAGHPLEPALQMAYAAMNNIRNNIKDYSCTMVKRERINGKLNEQEFMFLKVRHEPFSVYMYFLGPDKLRGQEAIYVEGKNNGNLLGHGVGIKKIAGTVPLQPTGAMAMQGQRYPITEIGMLNLTRRLVEVAEADKKFGECEVKFFNNAKINGRVVTCIQVVHPTPRKNFRFNVARVYVDNELNLPTRYESYDWPEKAGGQPVLLEEYTYTDIKLNNGFTDFDFDDHNPKYNFH